MPVSFYGTAFGGVTAGTTYYVRTIPTSTRFTISATPSTSSSTASAVTLSTASGTMYATPVSYLYIAAGTYDSTSNNRQVTTTTAVATTTYATNTSSSGNITMSSVSGLVVGQPIVFTDTTANTTVTNTNTSGNITVASTTNMVVGGRITFSGTLGGLSPATTYYITTVNTGTSNISVSTTFSGSNVSLTTASGSMTATTGGVMGGITQAQTYYITSLSGSNIQIATFQDSAPLTITNENGNMTATVTTDYVVTFNTSYSAGQFVANDPIIFTGNTFGGITADAVYYITSATSPNVSISATRYNGVAGPKATLTNDSSANHSGVTFTATSYTGEDIWKRAEFKGW